MQSSQCAVLLVKISGTSWAVGGIIGSNDCDFSGTFISDMKIRPPA